MLGNLSLLSVGCTVGMFGYLSLLSLGFTVRDVRVSFTVKSGFYSKGGVGIFYC